MRRRVAAPAWLLISFWLAAQMAPPVLLAGISSGDHSLSLAGSGSLLLRHDDHHASSDHRRSPLEKSLVIGFSESGGHEDHVVRLPDTDRASRPEMPNGLAMLADGGSIAPLVFTPTARLVLVGGSRPIGPAPPHRNRPLLL